MPLLTCKNISKSFPKRPKVLGEIDLSIEMGDQIAIIGRSGEGKSTLLSILCGLLEPSSGEVFFEERPLKKADTLQRRKMGFIFQSAYLLEDETVLDNILMPSYLSGHKASQAEIDQIAKELNHLGFAPSLTSKASVLSGGEKQKVAALRALWNHPGVLFADEPTGNLDSTSSSQLQDYILEKVAENKAAFILVTHDERFAARCKKVYSLEAGNLVQRKLSP